MLDHISELLIQFDGLQDMSEEAEDENDDGSFAECPDDVGDDLEAEH